MFSLVRLTSCFEAARRLFWDGPRKFQPWSVDEDPTFPPNTIVEKLKLPHDGRFKMYQAHIHAGVALEFARQGGTTCCQGIVVPCPLNRFSCCNGFRYGMGRHSMRKFEYPVRKFSDGVQKFSPMKSQHHRQEGSGPPLMLPLHTRWFFVEFGLEHAISNPKRCPTRPALGN
ncbi:hypothetical protein AVEN_41969-1 [Araneus ventricosus]|uniref:Uncharacterized protein n=1 Tax=Araneus ventricosus TaxID=182803 RepID=A0A4Y2RLU4_ARAVE|nr:hypothetical protein AVEN_41969-1 [Araneus ventricosus]